MRDLVLSLIAGLLLLIAFSVTLIAVILSRAVHVLERLVP